MYLIENIGKYLYNFKQILIKTNHKEYILNLKKDKYNCKVKKSEVKENLILEHNKNKKYILNENDEIDFLVSLGIMTRDYTVKKSSYNKFRQINKYLEIIDNTIDEILEKGLIKDKINVLDFGCGKSYLTFALYYYLENYRKELEFNIIGLDLKEDVIKMCSDLALKLNYNNIKFINQDIKDFNGSSVDLVISLHACNNATDYSILKALELDAKAFLAVPCCHNEFYNTINLSKELKFLEKDKIILEKFSALATDSYRAAAIELCGYKASISEFIDIEYTPKNLLIKAIKGNKKIDKKRYEVIKKSLGINPLLEKLISKYFK
ncbi:class I SAM-dependent methyltransferase [Oceanivirga salmonicida]|uniref:class I SAM-dependent methyltransferase n=1 Tax=Oceanivirga salmonicida TaxID=1769291 RepID=UPI0009E7ED5A|nr:SAM-dependent methyltransferase [Oceanivirga salmonicida]